jgi:hypothetical protein
MHLMPSTFQRLRSFHPHILLLPQDQHNSEIVLEEGHYFIVTSNFHDYNYQIKRDLRQHRWIIYGLWSWLFLNVSL